MNLEDLITYRSRRGKLELDLIFDKFCKKNLPDLSHKNKTLFLEMLELDDDELWQMIHQFESNTKFNYLIGLIKNNRELGGAI